MSPLVHIAFYRFVPLSGLDELRRSMRSLADRWELKGTIILAPEGINGFLAGPDSAIQGFREEMEALSHFRGMRYRVTTSAGQPYKRLKIKLKREIIPMRRESIQPALETGDRIEPATLKAWLDQGKPVRLLDTRNEYEIKDGTFVGATSLGVDTFQNFASALGSWKRPDAAPVVMFCTGGIRCEKATALALELGMSDVYQLDGGILGYLEQCGDAHYQGGCFVFDERGQVTAAESVRE